MQSNLDFYRKKIHVFHFEIPENNYGGWFLWVRGCINDLIFKQKFGENDKTIIFNFKGHFIVYKPPNYSHRLRF